MKRYKRVLYQMLMAQLSSAVATVTDFVLTAVLFRLLGLYYVWSTFLGSVAGGCVNGVVNYRWTFKGCDASKKRIFMRYIIVWGGSILLNTSGTSWGVLLVERNASTTLLPLLTVKMVVAILVAVTWNFCMQKYFVFRQKEND